MTHAVALQHDGKTLRGAVVESRPGGYVLAERFEIAGAQAKQLGEELARRVPAVRKAKGSRAGCKLVALAAVDKLRVRPLTLPAAPESELPDLVAMQMQRELSGEADTAVVDFAPLQGAADMPWRVIAVACPQAEIGFWEDLAEAAGASLEGLVVRGLAAASLVGRLAQGEQPTPRLIAAGAGEELDMVVLQGASASPWVLRSGRLVSDDPAGVINTLRRTAVAAQAEVGASIAAVVHAGLPAGVQRDELEKLAPSTHDALAGGALDGLVSGMGSDASDLAQCGAALDALGGARPSIDLAHPKKTLEQQGSSRSRWLLAAAAAVVLLAVGWTAYIRLATLDAEIAQTNSDIADARAAIEDFDPYRRQAEEIERWLTTDVTWLDELELLSRRLRPEPLDAEDYPVESDVRVTRLLATVASGERAPGGAIDLHAAIRSASTAELESRLRDGAHQVEPVSMQENTGGGAYGYTYQVVVRVPSEADRIDTLEPTSSQDAADEEAPE
ncbi:hypothetical protein Mal64_05280 [Pseudobythopirellula maris]|uniref:Competence protein A n=1 Tax=Pseudobythopirellula maris TaxID=2527991 RepID=A0A5C5ZRK8_9BACT|nr:hypothetical protein [Pseudobythopirellula maris]TWT90144.1 hypothetical protein Mal64_05280 [Pseudobythopirellula maris]